MPSKFGPIVLALSRLEVVTGSLEAFERVIGFALKD